MRAILQRLMFVLLSAVTMVVFSEKIYWYVSGYALAELVLYYAVPVYACLWAVDRFEVWRLPAIVLVAALYAFLVEGVLTPVLYEAGMLDPVMPAYFVGWHGLLAFVFGWYTLRRWLVQGKTKELLVSGTLVGLFWGLWSLPYRLPESVAEFEALAAQGETFIPGLWPVLDYGLFVITFTLVLGLAHWLLGRNWMRSFRPGRLDGGLILIALVFLFTVTVVPVLPLAFIKLGVLLGLIYSGLRKSGAERKQKSILDELNGEVRLVYLATLLAIPVSAWIVYAGAEVLQPSDVLLRNLFEWVVILQSLLGGTVFIWALIASQREGRSVTGSWSDG